MRGHQLILTDERFFILFFLATGFFYHGGVSCMVCLFRVIEVEFGFCGSGLLSIRIVAAVILLEKDWVF